LLHEKNAKHHSCFFIKKMARFLCSLSLNHQPPIIMNDPYATDASTLDSNAGFTAIPSVSQAANDLRAAAGEKIKDLTAQAASLKDRAVESATHFRDLTAEKAREARTAATEKAAAFKSAAGEKAQHFKEIANEQWSETREKAREAHSSAEDYIREHPTKCVLGAVGIGFLIGLIVRR
jgi:ElaB/YqjD/DUF883 family membrane-anchored ribosome-binding protein